MHHTDALRFLGTATGWNLFSGVHICFAISDLKLAATPRRPSSNGRPLITIYTHSWPDKLAIFFSRRGCIEINRCAHQTKKKKKKFHHPANTTASGRLRDGHHGDLLSVVWVIIPATRAAGSFQQELSQYTSSFRGTYFTTVWCWNAELLFRVVTHGRILDGR